MASILSLCAWSEFSEDSIVIFERIFKIYSFMLLFGEGVFLSWPNN